MGNLAGHGWSDNVTKIAYALSAMNALPDTINLAGWSRGAVTCIMAANKIYELFPEIKVNIFAIDPVAGFGNNEVSGDFNKRRTLPPSVRNFIAVLAIHEKRGFFNPVDATKIRISPRNSEGANILFLPMPGKHDSQTKQKDTDDPSSFLNLPSKVTHHLAFKFLSQFGTNFINGFDRSHGLRAVLELYSEMLLNWSGLEKSLTNKGMGQRAQGGFGKRGFAKTKELQRYTMHSNYFVNEHHRAVFRQVHPEVYDVIFSRTGHGFNVTRMRGAIAQLSTATYTSLEPYFEFTDHMTQGRLHLPIPGSGVDKDLQPLPYSQWPTLWNL
ncbi:MAG TPA: hypothetical protein PKD86_10435, partial [Gemmatales bacterium]|nr:hypothetical protein [Gemmatales bacterium]